MSWGNPNHNNLSNRAKQDGAKKLKVTKPEKLKLPKGKGTVKYPSTEQAKKSRWS